MSTKLSTDLVTLFVTGLKKIFKKTDRLNPYRFHTPFSMMLHISFEDKKYIYNTVDGILLVALRFAALSAHSLKFSPQCEELKQKVTPVPFIYLNKESNGDPILLSV